MSATNNLIRFEPATEAEAADTIREARATGRSFSIEGGGTRRGFGRPVTADAVLSTRHLSGITLYEPAELVVSARAGTPLSLIEETLAEKGQMLPFEPADYRALYGSHGEPSIGAVAACNISGPRRIQVGAARDHLIGVRLVNGRGEAVKSGGRVMKNVTGLDLVKLSCGAHGTLGLLTEVTFKLVPMAPAEASLVIEGLDDAGAVEAMSAALSSPFEVSGAAHLPAGLNGATATTLLRLERTPDSLDYRCGRLIELLGPYGTARRIEAQESRVLWRDIAQVAPLAKAQAPAIWRLSLPQRTAAQAMADISSNMGARYFFDWGGGLVWLAVMPADDAGASVVRHAVAQAGGYATLMRAPDDVRTRVDVFAPLGAPLMKITAGIKASFDPDGLLNPGRMYAGV
ncbi:MAG: linked oxidase domain protein [Hyphomicrobiales bacterium]|nr:linked oxidase domain protein [Hyphomicrobiales bacterium]